MSVTSSNKDIEAQERSLRKYHEYLNKNYTAGVERFFSPTGSLQDFQTSVKVSAHRTREFVVAKDAEHAAGLLEPVVAGGEGVFDLTAEPGTGKTSVLPFKFHDKKVVVAMPTPFDAWSAFQMATGACSLRLKGLRLGDTSSNVCYTDSYLAANMVLSNYLDYDVLIVDECDSGKGVSKFLADVRVKGKVVIRMSASHGRTSSGPSKSFSVTEDNTLPDVRAGLDGFVEVCKKKIANRSLVILPDAQTAAEVSERLPNSILVTSQSGLHTLARGIVDQTGDALFVSDDVCGRGLNLNIDVVMDSQLVTEHGVTRNLSKAELYQRKGRVGRNKPGWYVSPNLPTIDLRESEADVLRSNIMRSLASIEQSGPPDRHVSKRDAQSLLCSSVEPITIHKFQQEAVASSIALPDRSRPRHERKQSHGSSNTTGSNSSGRKEVSAPGWMSWLMPNAVEKIEGKKYYVCDAPSYSMVRKSDRGHARNSRDYVEKFNELSVAEGAPYASKSVARVASVKQVISLPDAPPTVDLTQITYRMDWPSALRDCALRGDALPTIVPPNNWRHTSAGGMATDWYARLDNLSIGEYTFVESELEVVCRAWNKLVASSWVKRTPGLSCLENDESRLQFCIRYFQSYYAMLAL